MTSRRATVTERDEGPGFAERIREQTSVAHRETNESRFVSALLDGELNVDGYAALLAQTYLVYTKLEDAGRSHAHDDLVALFLAEELLRVPALEADLEFLLGPNWRSTITALPATTKYLDRLDEVAFDWPVGFVAHHYIRYLGDLSGGQIVRRKLEHAYGFRTEGVQFYTFDGIPKPKPFKDAYRMRLDSAPLSEQDRQDLIGEVHLAYRLNGELFADLEADIESYLVK
ncbi:MAG: biliverdin-producing heme oxygenase [Rhodococcus sp.]|nr:biliverdin-producing heme oxygenase [Rhodococcus sp. (in: high G+C Gram-positive bacteria)]